MRNVTEIDISVIVPIFNGKKWINRCIESVESQMLKEIEIICVDGHVKRGKYVSSHVHLNLTYLLEVDENEDLKIKEDENSGVRWVNIEDVEKVVTEKWVAENVYRKLNEKLKNIKEA